jgi:hypothetical protein
MVVDDSDLVAAVAGSGLVASVRINLNSTVR